VFRLAVRKAVHRIDVSPEAERAQPQDWCLADADDRQQPITAMQFVVHDTRGAGERSPRSRANVRAGDDCQRCRLALRRFDAAEQLRNVGATPRAVTPCAA